MSNTFTYNPATDAGAVRLLLNDVDQGTAVFTDAEITAFLTHEGGIVKLAAAQAIDTNADNEVLASKVLTTQDLSTDGAKLADALHKRAQALRDQHYSQLEDDGFFDIVEAPNRRWPELTEHYGFWNY
jgi:hypothetical protein